MSSSKQGAMTRRSFLRAVATGGAALLLSACGANSAQTSGSTGSGTAAPASSSGGSETLKIALFGTEVGGGDKATTDSFKTKNPNVNVEITPIQGTDWEAFFSKILTNVAAGNVPDLVFVATEGTQLFAGQGLARPLDDYVKKDQAAMAEYFKDVHPSLIEAMMYEGSLYELPRDFNAANMYINTKALKDAGLSFPAEDWTKDDFYSMAQKMTKKDGGQTSVFGYAWVNRLWGGWLPWIFVNGSNLLTEEEAPGGDWVWNTFYKDDPSVKNRGGGWRWPAPKANDPANVEALDFVIQMQKEGLTPAADLGGGSSVQGFFTGSKLGMTPGGGFWAGGLHNAGMKPEDFDAQLFPKWKSQRHQFGTAGFVIMKEAKNPDLGWEYIKHTIQKDVMTPFFDGNGTTPTRRSMMTDERYKPTGPQHWQVFYDTLDKHPDTAPIPAPPESNPMTTIFTKYTGLAVSGEQSPKDALDAMQKDLEALWAKRKK